MDRSKGSARAKKAETPAATDDVRITRISPAKGYSLRITWRDNRSDTVDLSGAVASVKNLSGLAALKKVAGARITDGGKSVTWPDGSKASALMLRRIADEQQKFTAKEFRRWQDRLDLTNQEVADIFGVTSRTVNNIRAGKSVFRIYGIAARAIERDPVLLHALLQPGRSRRI